MLCLTLVTPWTVVCWASLSMEFPRQEYWSRFPFPFQGVFQTQGLHLALLYYRRMDSLLLSHQGSPIVSAWLSKHLFTKQLLFYLHVNCLSLLWCPKPLWQHSLLSSAEWSLGWGFHFAKLLKFYIIKLLFVFFRANVPNGNLILRLTRRTQESRRKFLPLWQGYSLRIFNKNNLH